MSIQPHENGATGGASAKAVTSQYTAGESASEVPIPTSSFSRAMRQCMKMVDYAKRNCKLHCGVALGEMFCAGLLNPRLMLRCSTPQLSLCLCVVLWSYSSSRNSSFAEAGVSWMRCYASRLRGHFRRSCCQWSI